METNQLAETTRTVLAEGEGLRLQSGPGRDLIFKVTGDNTGGAFDYFIVEVSPRSGPPLHVHHLQEETIHVLKGYFKIRIGDEKRRRLCLPAIENPSRLS
jgi:quercetin dioxygenase-like cupin family protein